MDDLKPQTESWLRGYAKFLGPLLGAGVLAGISTIFKKIIPDWVGLIFLGLFVILVVFNLFRVLWKVFRPDDPADLSLK
jgi:ABC-type branched-subunit amino acid transport system permease subunit